MFPSTNSVKYNFIVTIVTPMVRLFRDTIGRIHTNTWHKIFGEGLELRCLNNPPLYPPYEYGYRVHEISVTYNRKANILNRWAIATYEG